MNTKIAVIKCINGNFAVDSEHSDLQAAKVKYHDVSKNRNRRRTAERGRGLQRVHSSRNRAGTGN